METVHSFWKLFRNCHQPHPYLLREEKINTKWLLSKYTRDRGMQSIPYAIYTTVPFQRLLLKFWRAIRGKVMIHADWLTHVHLFNSCVCVGGGWKVANYVPVNWSYAWWWGNFNEPNKLNSCPSRADGLSIKYLYKRTTTCDWEKSSEPCDLKCGPRMVEINVCFVFQSQKSMKCINFVKEARNTTGLETLKTSKACDNWAEAFFSNKDRNTNVQEDMYLEVIGRAV